MSTQIGQLHPLLIDQYFFFLKEEKIQYQLVCIRASTYTEELRKWISYLGNVTKEYLIGRLEPIKLAITPSVYKICLDTIILYARYCKGW